MVMKSSFVSPWQTVRNMMEPGIITVIGSPWLLKTEPILRRIKKYLKKYKFLNFLIDMTILI